MKRKMVIVTQADIDNGKRGSYCECPVALAVRRVFRARPDRPVRVRPEGIIVGDLEDDLMWIGEVPTEIDRFIERFDRGDDVLPMRVMVNFR